MQGAGGAVEGGDAVVGGGGVLGGLEAVALLRDEMQQPGAGHLFHVLEGGDDGVDVVAVDGADVVEAELFEVGAGHDHAFHVLFPAAGELAQLWQSGQRAFAAFAHAGVEAPGQQFGKVAADGADRGADGHVVVVEDDQQVGVERAAVVEGFEGHAGAERAVADDGDDLSALAFELGGDGHAERGADRGAGVADAEGVVVALAALGKAGQAALLAHAVHALAPAGEDLVRVGLVADVPDDAIVRGVEDVMQADGQFDDAEPGREVSAGARDAVDQKRPQFLRQLAKFGAAQATQVGGAVDAAEQGVGGGGGSIALFGH